MTGADLVRRLVAAMGLVLMIPIATQMIDGTVSPSDAATRAAILLVGVVLVRKLADLVPGGPDVLIPAPDAGAAGPEEPKAA